MKISKVVSGGQTGADRAALDWALSVGIPCGGWCPRGRRAEDGTINLCYPLTETPSFAYTQRTEWNARDSDGTVIFSISPELTEGSLKTALCASAKKRPWLHLSSVMLGGDCERAGAVLIGFVEEHQIQVLNIAGPRQSKEDGIRAWVMAVLEKAFPQIGVD